MDTRGIVGSDRCGLRASYGYSLISGIERLRQICSVGIRFGYGCAVNYVVGRIREHRFYGIRSISTEDEAR